MAGLNRPAALLISAAAGRFPFPAGDHAVDGPTGEPAGIMECLYSSRSAKTGIFSKGPQQNPLPGTAGTGHSTCYLRRVQVLPISIIFSSHF